MQKKKELPFFTTGDNTIRGICEKISSFGEMQFSPEISEVVQQKGGKSV